MISYSTIIYFLVFISPVFSDSYVCNGTINISPPNNLNDTYKFPSTWNVSQPAPYYEAGANCQWKISVPQGMYAYFSGKSTTPIIEANLTQPAVYVTDSIGQPLLISNMNQEPFFFVSPGFSISLISPVTGTLGFEVKWTRMPEFAPQHYKIAKEDEPLILHSTDTDSPTVITADTKVSLLAFPSQFVFLNYLRLTVVYDGPSWNSTYLGNLYDILSKDNQLVSSGNQLTLYTLMPNIPIGNSIVLQDYENTKRFVNYKALYCIVNVCPRSVDATNGTSAGVFLSATPLYLKTLGLGRQSTLSIYRGRAVQSNLITKYNYDQTATNIPQQFLSYMTTFVVDSAGAYLEFDFNPITAKWYTLMNNRHAFVESPSFSQSSLNQNFTFHSSDVDLYNFTTSIVSKQGSLSGSSSLQITVFNGQTTVYDETFTNQKQPTNAVNFAKGNTLFIKYISDGATTGMHVDFSMQKVSSSGILGYMLSFLIAIIAIV